MTHDRTISAVADTTTCWVKSSYSGGSNGSCVAYASGLGDLVPVRDTKQSNGDVLVFGISAWSQFVAAISGGDIS